MRRVLAIAGCLLASQIAHASLSGVVRESPPTFALRQGYQQLGTFTTVAACEAEAQRRTTNAGAVRRIFQRKSGTGTVISEFSSHEDCKSAVISSLTEAGAHRPTPPHEKESNVNSCVSAATYSDAFQPPTCVTTYNFGATYVATSTPPVTCPALPPARAIECPDGFYGAWWGTPTMSAPPGCAVTWSPAPAGTCKPNPVCNCEEPAPIPGTPTASVSPDGLAARLTWTASSDALSYGVEKCRGNQCDNFAALACTIGQSYGDPLPAGATARYRVRGNDAAACAGAYGAFSAPVQLTVTSSAPGQATLSWIAPTTNTDGSTISNLAGFYLVWGNSAATLNQQYIVTGAGVSTHTLTGLSAGTTYFAVKAYTSGFGAVSNLSNVVAKAIQ